MKSLWYWMPLLLLCQVATAQEPAQTMDSRSDSMPLARSIQDAVAVDAGPTAFDEAGPARQEGGFLTGNPNFSNFIPFMSNPLQSIDPRALTYFYPIFGSSWTSAFPPLPNGDIQLYGAGLTVALSDRLAVGLNQGGYAVSKFGHDARDGWLNLGGFAQYTVIQDVEDQFLLTGGLRWEAPTGEAEVFQGHGPAHLAPYLTAGKEFGEFHVLGTFGYQFPTGSAAESTSLFYFNTHFDRRFFGWLYPLIEFNWTYHTSSVNEGLSERTGGFFDFGNFTGTGNILIMSVGFDAVLIQNKLETGIVYNTSLAAQHDFDVNGLLVKVVLRY
jgi:hypothetical protein